MKWYFGISFALVLAVIGGVGLVRPDIYMNAALSEHHAEAAKSCRTCHIHWMRTSRTFGECGASDCHGWLRSETVHVGKNAGPCNSCHKLHDGRTSDGTRAPDSRCLSCHDELDRDGKHPVGKSCVQCHPYHLPSPRLASKRVSYVPVKLSHKIHVEFLGEMYDDIHGDGVCLKCHTLKGHRFQAVSHRTCSGEDCHTINKDGVSPRCVVCHSLSAGVSKRGLRFSHAKHSEEEAGATCGDCHLARNKKFILVNREACLDCHDVDHDVTKQPTGEKCGFCHASKPKPPLLSVKFAHAVHVETKKCERCHENISHQKKIQPPDLLKAGFCVQCHDKKE